MDGEIELAFEPLLPSRIKNCIIIQTITFHSEVAFLSRERRHVWYTLELEIIRTLGEVASEVEDKLGIGCSCTGDIRHIKREEELEVWICAAGRLECICNLFGCLGVSADTESESITY